MTKSADNNSANSSFESDLFRATEKLRGSADMSEYRDAVLSLVFLKYISDKGTFSLPEEAQWSYLRANSNQVNIGELVDRAMMSIEEKNENLKDVFSKDYARSTLNVTLLGKLIDLFSNVTADKEDEKSHEIMRRVFEHFLNRFFKYDRRREGEYSTPNTLAHTVVAMLKPHEGIVYDPCCGLGGMFVRFKKFAKTYDGHINNTTISGQEINHTIWRLCKMNLTVHGIDADIRWNSAGSFHQDELSNLCANYIFSNPPFHIFDWGSERLREDPRWKYGTPPRGNANYAWLQHILHHLAPNGTAGVILANNSMSSIQSMEKSIRKGMIEDDVIDCMVSLPGQLFSSTQIPVCLWILSKDKKSNVPRNRSGEILFIAAHKLGVMRTRMQRIFTDNDVNKIAETYHRWREGHDYEDVPGFCKSASLEEVRDYDHTLMPGWYVGAEKVKEDTIPFIQHFATLQTRGEFEFTEDGGIVLTDAINDIFSDVKIPTLVLNKQRKIVTRRLELDKKIEQNQKMNDLLEDMIRALFRDWFVNFGPTRAKMEEQDPYLTEKLWTLFPNKLDEEKKPEGWKLRPISDFARIENGENLEKENFVKDGLNPVFGGAGIMGHTNKSNVDGFSIIVVRMGSRCGQFYAHYGKAWINKSASQIIPLDNISREWLLLALQSLDINLIKKGFAIPFVSSSDILKMKINIPNKEILVFFNKIVKPIKEKQEMNKRDISSLKDRRRALFEDVSKFSKGGDAAQ